MKMINNNGNLSDHRKEFGLVGLANFSYRLASTNNSSRPFMSLSEPRFGRSLTSNFPYSHLGKGHFSLQDEEFTQYFRRNAFVCEGVQRRLQLDKSFVSDFSWLLHASFDFVAGINNAQDSINRKTECHLTHDMPCFEGINSSSFTGLFCLKSRYCKTASYSRNGADGTDPVRPFGNPHFAPWNAMIAGHAYSNGDNHDRPLIVPSHSASNLSWRNRNTSSIGGGK